MSFADDRQAELDPVVDTLKKIEGIKIVEQDDFDSMYINVFLTMTGEGYGGTLRGRTRPMRFSVGIRKTKNAIKRICEEHGVDFNFLDWPTIQYETMDRKKINDGYNHDQIKIEIAV